MNELQSGDLIKDNDPRMAPRELEIIDVLPFGVVAKDKAGRYFNVLKRRIHTDGKPRRSGFDLIRTGAKP